MRRNNYLALKYTGLAALASYKSENLSDEHLLKLCVQMRFRFLDEDEV